MILSIVVYLMLQHVVIKKADVSTAACNNPSTLHTSTDFSCYDHQGWDPSNPAIVSQDREGIGDSPSLSSNNEEDCMTIPIYDPEYSNVAAQMSSVSDEKYDFFSADI